MQRNDSSNSFLFYMTRETGRLSSPEGWVDPERILPRAVQNLTWSDQFTYGQDNDQLTIPVQTNCPTTPRVAQVTSLLSGFSSKSGFSPTIFPWLHIVEELFNLVCGRTASFLTLLILRDAPDHLDLLHLLCLFFSPVPIHTFYKMQWYLTHRAVIWIFFQVYLLSCIQQGKQGYSPRTYSHCLWQLITLSISQ